MRKRLIGLRKGAGYTQQTFSDKLGISRSHYAQIESGEKNPSLKLSLKIKGAHKYLYHYFFFTQKRPVSRHNPKYATLKGANLFRPCDYILPGEEGEINA